MPCKSADGLKREIVRYAQDLGFDLVRIASAESFTEDREEALKRVRDGYMDGMHWWCRKRCELNVHLFFIFDSSLAKVFLFYTVHKCTKVILLKVSTVPDYRQKKILSNILIDFFVWGGVSLKLEKIYISKPKTKSFCAYILRKSGLGDLAKKNENCFQRFPRS